MKIVEQTLLSIPLKEIVYPVQATIVNFRWSFDRFGIWFSPPQIGVYLENFRELIRPSLFQPFLVYFKKIHGNT